MKEKKMILSYYQKDGDMAADGGLDITVKPAPPSEAPAEDDPVVDTTGEAMVCRDYTSPENFGLPAETSITIPDNCALGAYEVDQFEDIPNAIYCLSCKKGYKPTLDSRKVTACAEITNCQSSKIFNGCSTCETPFDEETKTCSTVDVGDPNCMRSANGTCKVCKINYTINADGFCEKISTYKCKTGHFELPNGFLTKSIEFIMSQGDRIGQGTKNFGCSECDTDFVAISGLVISNVCMVSEYLKLNSLPNNTNFIKNCLKYGYDFANTQMSCMICKSGMMPDANNSKCLTQLPGCLKAKIGNDNACAVCDNGKTLIGIQCVDNAIANCSTFKDNLGVLNCVKCLPGFYIKDAIECLEGKVANCDIFDTNSAEKCIQCIDKFVIYENSQGKTFCLSYENFNCLEWNNNNSFLCNSCIPDFFPASPLETDPADVCVGGNYSIDDCDELDPTLLCVICSGPYYLNSSRTECIRRENQIAKCKKYVDNEDSCETCDEKHYLHANGQCYPYPVGIQFCLIYQDKDTCIQCDTNKYLSKNLCLNVDAFVDNCFLYSDNGKCNKCTEGFFFADETTCSRINALNCDGYVSADECLSCPKKYGFIQKASVKECTEVQLANCAENTLTEPYMCTLCDTKFYLIEEKCEKASPDIVSCLHYLDNTHCNECEEYFVLSADKRKCVSNYITTSQIDYNCEVYVETEFTCASCPANMYFALPGAKNPTADTETSTPAARLLSSWNKNRILEEETVVGPNYTCQKCGGDGCFICSPIDFSICIICVTGYHMIGDSTCKIDVPIIVGPTEEKTSVSVVAVLNMLLIFLSLLVI